MASKTSRVGQTVQAATVALAAFPSGAMAQSFVVEGSDAIMGVGARHLAMGGTGTATARDPHAVFYNSSLLVDVDRITVTGTRQIDAELRPYTFIGAAVPLPFLEDTGLDATFGFARYNRVHARSSGAFGENDPESIFLRYLLPGISGTFDGDIDSKTLVNRFALGVSHEALPALSLGVNVDWIDCKTNSCGVHSGSVGREVASVHATALSFGFSAAFKPNDRLTLGASYTDIGTTLKVDTIITDDSGTRERLTYAELPAQLKLEAAYALNDKWLIAGGYQKMWGQYGSYVLNYETAHVGVEYAKSDSITWRGGFWAPIAIESSKGFTFEFPYGLATVPIPSMGVGFDLFGLKADVGAYLNPYMTLHEKWPVVSGDVTLTYSF